MKWQFNFSFFKLPNEQLRVLLSKSRWDINAFLEKFYDGRIETPSPPAGSPFPVVTDTAQLKENRPDNHQIATHQMATRSSKRKNDKAVVNKVPAKTLKGAKGKPQQNCEICWENVKPEVGEIPKSAEESSDVPFLSAHSPTELRAQILQSLFEELLQSQHWKQFHNRLHRMPGSRVLEPLRRRAGFLAVERDLEKEVPAAHHQRIRHQQSFDQVVQIARMHQSHHGRPGTESASRSMLMRLPLLLQLLS